MYLVTHSSDPSLPCVAKRVTMVNLPRSTCSHWLRSSLKGDQPPCLIPTIPLFLTCSLARLAAKLSSLFEEALIWTSEIAPLSMPTGAMQSELFHRLEQKRTLTISTKLEHCLIISNSQMRVSMGLTVSRQTAWNFLPSTVKNADRYQPSRSFKVSQISPFHLIYGLDRRLPNNL